MRLHVQDVVAQLVFAERGRIDPVVLVQEPHRAVVAVPRPRRIVPQRQQLGIAPHRVVGVPVNQRVAMTLPRPGVDALQECATLALLWFDDVAHEPPPSHIPPSAPPHHQPQPPQTPFTTSFSVPRSGLVQRASGPNPCPCGTFGIPPANPLRGQEECRKQAGIGHWGR